MNEMKAPAADFGRMFQNGMKEALEGQVEIKEFPYDVVKAAVQHSYDFDIAGLLDDSQYLLLAQFADMYDMTNLKVKFAYIFCIKVYF